MSNKNIIPLLERLLSERKEYKDISIPEDYPTQRSLLRGLSNVRMPRPLEKKWLDMQDAELQLQLEEKGSVGVEDIAPIGAFSQIRLWQGDITRLRVGAIVNAANSQLLGCFIPNHRCIDNAIHSAAGIQLRDECEQIMQQQGYEEPTGSARITQAYNLPSTYVIHTVGPIISGDEPLPSQEAELSSCYRSSMELADKAGVESLAFCCISTGEFHFPNELAAQIAIKTVKEYLPSASSLKTVIFNVFKDQDYEIYRRLLS